MIVIAVNQRAVERRDTRRQLCFKFETMRSIPFTLFDASFLLRCVKSFTPVLALKTLWGVKKTYVDMASPLRKERNGTVGLHQNTTPSYKNSLDSGQDQPQQDIQNVVDIRTVRVSSIGFLEKTWKEGRKKERPAYTDSREEFLWVTGTPGALLCSVGHRPFRVAPEGQRILFSELFL